jgi:hypothetical protein
MIEETVKALIGEQHIVYHQTREKGKIKNRNGIWLANSPDEQSAYGEYTYRFDIEGLNIADQDTVTEYIKKYDICDFKGIENDVNMVDGYIGELLLDIENGEITPEEALDEIRCCDLQGVFIAPYEYKFPNELKRDGYDGYKFEYDGYDYYYVFYPDKCKFLGEYNEEDEV